MGDWVDRREQKEKEEGIHCIICDKLCKNAYGLVNHVSKTHRIPFFKYKERVLEAAEKEYFELKVTADETRLKGLFKSDYANIQHLFELLKEKWKP